jgi:hypothetical protein
MTGQTHQINPSILTMRAELIKRKRKKDYYGKLTSIGMGIGLIPLLPIFFTRDMDIGGLLQSLTNPLIVAGLALFIGSIASYNIYYVKAKTKYDALREEVMSKIWIDFCTCLPWSPCNHKEEFMAELKQNYNINLYWK